MAHAQTARDRRTRQKDHSVGGQVKARSTPHPLALFWSCLRPSEGHARTLANRAETALTDAVRTRLKMELARARVRDDGANDEQ